MSGYTDLTKLENSRNCLRRIARHDEPQFSKDSIVNVMEKFVKTVNIMDDTILVPCRLMDRQVGDSTDNIPAPGKDSTSNQQTTLYSNGQGKRTSTQSKNVHEFLNSSELFNLYNMLNSLKNELLWTGKDQTVEDEENNAFSLLEKSAGLHTTATTDQELSSNIKTESSNAVNRTNPTTITTTATTTGTKGHVRRPSTASVTSTASVSNLSDTESDISSQENDSGVESEGNKSDNTQSNSSSADSVTSSEDLHAQKNIDKATELAKRCKRHLNGLYHCLEQMTEAANYLTARYQSDIGPLV